MCKDVNVALTNHFFERRILDRPLGQLLSQRARFAEYGCLNPNIFNPVSPVWSQSGFLSEVRDERRADASSPTDLQK